MRIFMTVVGYTIKDTMKKKTFIFSTIFMLLVATLVGSFPAIKNMMTSNKSSSSSTSNSDSDSKGKTEKKGVLYYSDPLNILEGDLSKMQESFPNYDIESIDENLVNAKISEIKSNENEFLVTITKNEGEPIINYFYSGKTKELSPTTVKNAVKESYLALTLKEYNLKEADLEKVLSGIYFNSSKVSNADHMGLIVSMVVNLFLFSTIYFYGYGIAMSVASEKTSRIMEILITSASPAKILLGKCVGMGILGLLQMASTLLVGTAIFSVTSRTEASMYSDFLKSIHVSPKNIILIVIFFVLGYAIYSMMNSVAGSCVSKAEDVQSALTPISMISIFSFYLGYFTLKSPGTALSKFASYMPFSSPFAMSGRLFVTEVSGGELALSIGILVVTIIVISLISIGFYSKAILHYGKRLKIKDIKKLSK